MPFQSQVDTDMKPSAAKDPAQLPNPEINLENAVIEIDGKRHSVKELLALVVKHHMP